MEEEGRKSVKLVMQRNTKGNASKIKVRDIASLLAHDIPPFHSLSLFKSIPNTFFDASLVVAVVPSRLRFYL